MKDSLAPGVELAMFGVCAKLPATRADNTARVNRALRNSFIGLSLKVWNCIERYLLAVSGGKVGLVVVVLVLLAEFLAPVFLAHIVVAHAAVHVLFGLVVGAMIGVFFLAVGVGVDGVESRLVLVD